MLIQKTNPVGLDFYIQRLQTEIHTRLLTGWGIESDVYHCHERCYRNKTSDGYIAEVFHGGKDYKEVYWNDNLTAISFFGISNNIKRGIQSEAHVHLVFFVDLSRLTLQGNEIDHRADNEARGKVEEIIGRYSNGFTLLSTELWLENVLREYPGSRRDGTNLKYVDMHPVHCFRLNLKLVYKNKHC
jgi:hypothetical protein